MRWWGIVAKGCRESWVEEEMEGAQSVETVDPRRSPVGMGAVHSTWLGRGIES